MSDWTGPQIRVWGHMKHAPMRRQELIAKLVEEFAAHGYRTGARARTARKNPPTATRDARGVILFPIGGAR